MTDTHDVCEAMFAFLVRYPKILVTGPQRSGTTICARMIALDTGHEYVDEKQIQIDRRRLLENVLRSGRPVVVQCPGLCHGIQDFADSETAVVLMRRPITEILASQQRIGWGSERVELAKHGLREGIIAHIKYDHWERHQRNRIAHVYEIRHADLATHPLWIPKPQRTHFGPRQTQP